MSHLSEAKIEHDISGATTPSLDGTGLSCPNVVSKGANGSVVGVVLLFVCLHIY